MLVFRRNKFHLFYNPDPNKGRFNFAHEVAHYLIDDHHQAIRFGSFEHKSYSGFIKSDNMEKEADWFASGLLMPTYLFEAVCPDPNFKSIIRIANKFDVSLTSAVLRTIDLTPVRTALIITKDGYIDWYRASADMIYSGVYSAKIGERPPLNSKTAEIVSNLDQYDSSPIEGKRCLASDWFKSFKNDPFLWEEVFPLSRFGQVLTLLTFYDD